MPYKPLVSIRLMTYNHSDFILDALEGINKQETNFIFEVVVGDDFSQDGTLNKIQDFHFTNPNLRLKILDRPVGGRYHELRQKKGRIFNFIDILENCEGKYVALLDGDDYWIDSRKLQKQVDFLEKNDAYNLISGNVREFWHDRNEFSEVASISDYTITYRDLLERAHCKTCTMMFRNNLPLNLPSLVYKEVGVDRQICLLSLGKEGKGFVSSETVAVYRRHGNSITLQGKGNTTVKTKIQSLFGHIRIAVDWNTYFGGEDKDIVRKVKLKRGKQMLRILWDTKEYGQFFKVLKNIMY